MFGFALMLCGFFLGAVFSTIYMDPSKLILFNGLVLILTHSIAGVLIGRSRDNRRNVGGRCDRRIFRWTVRDFPTSCQSLGYCPLDAVDFNGYFHRRDALSCLPSWGNNTCKGLHGRPLIDDFAARTGPSVLRAGSWDASRRNRLSIASTPPDGIGTGKDLELG